MTSLKAAHVEWLRARTTLAELNSDDGGEYGDEPMNAALDALQAAEWKLLQARSADINDIHERARIVADMFAMTDFAGEPADNRHRLMLSALIKEVLDYRPSATAATR